jgi:phosphoribosylformimino-5-aminoimidazole carboxamide ribotide isomerase
MNDFTIFPAIDLRGGKVVRLTQGDPNRQKTYSQNPARVAGQMLDDGAQWLHVVNLDAAFSESSTINFPIIQDLVKISIKHNANLQLGGGFRSSEMVKQAIEMGVSRVIIGSLAVKKPEFVHTLMQNYSADQIAVSLDGLNKKVMVSGWQEPTEAGILETAKQLKISGLQWLIYTDIKRDGMQSGSDFESTLELVQETGLNVIASGGVSSLNELVFLKNNGVAGAIVGKALYEGTVRLKDMLSVAGQEKV